MKNAASDAVKSKLLPTSRARIPSKEMACELIKKVWEPTRSGARRAHRKMRIVSFIDGFALASPHPITG